MFTSLHARLKRASRLLPLALLPFAAHAQIAPYTFSQTAGTYTAVTGGTVLGSTTSDDQQFNDPAVPAGIETPAAGIGLPIGFNFQFGGITYDRFAVNANGWMTLGNSSAGATAVTARFATGANNYAPIASTETPPANVIAPFADDLRAQAGSQLSYTTIGTAPNRTLVVEWSKYEYYTRSTASSGSFTFQVRLNETSNAVVFSYGTFTTPLVPTDDFYAQVGLRGTSVFDFNNRITSTTWAASTPGTSADDVMPVDNTVLPPSGLTYTFTPAIAPATDAAVLRIYALGKVAASFVSPVTVSALVRNAGSTPLTNLPVTLTVSGATTYTNTQTVASLAVGALTTVTFTAFPVTASTGTNTLTVTVPNDGLAASNSRVFTQTLSAADLSYLSGNVIDGAAGLSTAGSVIAVGYRTTKAASVTAVTSYFGGTAATAGSVYQVLIYSATSTGQPGTILYTSPDRTRPAGTAGTVTPDVVTIPNIGVNGAFFIGLRTIGAENIGLVYQNEFPLRPGTFFFTTTNGTTWTDINTQSLNSRFLVDVALGTVLTATRNEALAATVSLSPNPARGSFTLGVPAGSLRAASATLINALGQMVQTRQLNLPAADGNAEFDVSRLAAGLYTLQLKSANDLVVKRVVVE
jgi:hypothetical protein